MDIGSSKRLENETRKELKFDRQNAALQDQYKRVLCTVIHLMKIKVTLQRHGKQ